MGEEINTFFLGPGAPRSQGSGVSVGRNRGRVTALRGVLATM